MIKAIIFDFDMTLVDSSKINMQTLLKLKKEFNIDWLLLSKKDMWGIPYEEFIKKLSKTSKNIISIKKLRDKQFEYSVSSYKKLKINSINLLKLLNKKNIKLAIITNNKIDFIKIVLNKDPIKKIKFDFVLATNNSNKKSDLIDYCVKKWNIEKNECIYIGDHINDILAAKKSKVISMGVASGFYSINELKKYNPNMVISNLKELKKYII